jgi:hypothetical protein
MTSIEHLKAQPIAVSVVVGLFASLCCMVDRSYSHLLGQEPTSSDSSFLNS